MKKYLLFLLAVVLLFVGCSAEKVPIAITLNPNLPYEMFAASKVMDNTYANAEVTLPNGNYLWNNTLEKYAFIGWSTSLNGNVEYKAYDKFSSKYSTTLYGVWEAWYEESGNYRVDPYGKLFFIDKESITGDIVIPSEINGRKVILLPSFSYNEKISSISIPGTVKTIEEFTFKLCSGLKSITLRNGVEIIDDNAFYGCTNLTSVTIPNSVTSIGNAAFCSCKGLTSISIPNSVLFIGDYSFSDCTGLSNIEIPNSVIAIGDSAFAECDFTSIIIPDSVGTIGISAFTRCKKLENVTISASVSMILRETFYDCTNLKSVTIPKSVDIIMSNAFGVCTNLTSINYLGTKKQWNNIEKYSNWDTWVPSTCVIHCTDGDLPIR